MEYLPTRKYTIHGSYAFFTGWHICLMSREKYHRFKRCRLVSVCSCWWLFRLRKPHTENGTETSCLHHLPPWRAAGQLLLCWRRKESGPLLVIHGGIWGIIFNQWPCKWVTVFFLTPVRCISGVMGPLFFTGFWGHFGPTLNQIGSIGNLACQACERLRSMWKANLALTMWCLALLVHLNLFVPIPTAECFFQVCWCLKWSLFGSVASSVIARFHVLGKHPSIQLQVKWCWRGPAMFAIRVFLFKPTMVSFGVVIRKQPKHQYLQCSSGDEQNHMYV